MNFNVRSTYLFNDAHIFSLFLSALGLAYESFGTFVFLVCQFDSNNEATHTPFRNANFFLS